MMTPVKQEAIYPVYILDYTGNYPSEVIDEEQSTLDRWRNAIQNFYEAQKEIREAFVKAQERRMKESEY